MEKIPSLTDFNRSVNELICCEQSRKKQIEGLQKLAKIMDQITSVSAFQNASDIEDTSLESGLAISPMKAAQCFIDGVRTIRFWQGIKEAIEDRLGQKRHLRILYAGSGPYGAILLPILPFFQDADIRVTILDIHPENLRTVNTVIEFLEISDKVSRLYCADATVWQPLPGDSPTFDLIISETMTNFLVDEPQVNVFAHLQKFLAEDGNLVPQEIELSMTAKQITPANTLAVTVEHPIFSLDRAMAERIDNARPSHYEYNLNLGSEAPYWNRFLLRTVIKIYKTYQLSGEDCLITADIEIDRFNVRYPGVVNIRYELTERPVWYFNFSNTLRIGGVNRARSHGSV